MAAAKKTTTKATKTTKATTPKVAPKAPVEAKPKAITPEKETIVKTEPVAHVHWVSSNEAEITLDVTTSNLQAVERELKKGNAKKAKITIEILE